MRGRRARVDTHRAADPVAVRAGALAMLGRREYASAELIQALARKGYDQQVTQQVVAELAADRLLDDERYAGSMVRMLSGRGQGPARIRQALAEAGLATDLIEAALDAGPDWCALAGSVRVRKFGAATPGDWPERARQMRALQYRGFSRAQIDAALDAAGCDGDTALEHDAS